MRNELRKLDGLRAAFSGTVVRFGTKPAYYGYGDPIPTVVLENVKDRGGRVVADHLWFTVGKRIAALHLMEGDVMVFEARVSSYQKGYKGCRDDVYAPVSTDYRLSNPSRVDVIRVKIEAADTKDKSVK